MIKYFNYLRITKIKITITMLKINICCRTRTPAVPQRKFSNEIRSLLCPLNLQKARLFLTDMRILQLILILVIITDELQIQYPVAPKTEPLSRTADGFRFSHKLLQQETQLKILEEHQIALDCYFKHHGSILEQPLSAFREEFSQGEGGGRAFSVILMVTTAPREKIWFTLPFLCRSLHFHQI